MSVIQRLVCAVQAEKAYGLLESSIAIANVAYNAIQLAFCVADRPQFTFFLHH